MSDGRKADGDAFGAERQSTALACSGVVEHGVCALPLNPPLSAKAVHPTDAFFAPGWISPVCAGSLGL